MTPHWTLDEDKELVRMYARGAPVKVIAEKLKRTRPATLGRVAHLRKLGVPIPRRMHKIAKADLAALIAIAKAEVAKMQGGA